MKIKFKFIPCDTLFMRTLILYNVCQKYAFIVAEMGKDCSSRPYSWVDTHTLIYSPDKIHCTSHFLTLAAILIFFAGLFTLSSEEKGKNSCVQVFLPIFWRANWEFYKQKKRTQSLTFNIHYLQLSDHNYGDAAATGH